MINLSEYRYGAPTFPSFAWITSSSHSGLYFMNMSAPPPLDVLSVAHLCYGGPNDTIIMLFGPYGCGLGAIRTELL